MRFLYNFSIYLYIISIRIASLFNAKAKIWLNGRKNIFENLKHSVKNENNIVWFHCASLGEFEQGKPIIEHYKNKYPSHKILLTFFSPSGFQVKKQYEKVHWVFYLPADTARNAKRFIEIVRPLKVVFIKYEFWFNYMNELKRRAIPFYSAASIFRKEQPFFVYTNSWFAKQLKNVTHFFVQDSHSKELLSSIEINNVTISGDTRFDCVKSNAQNTKPLPLIETFSKNKPTIICGSTWPRDEVILTNYIRKNPQYNYIIAPHEMNNINRLKKETNALLFSAANQQNICDTNVLIIDSIGLLSSIYRYGKMAYIGGGFGIGIHNVLEAITFNIPVIFGPNYKRFNEAKELIKLGTARSISNYEELKSSIEFFCDFKPAQIKNYIDKKIGASKCIVEHI